MRFAIWAAVSSEAQAGADKVSLQEQERLCRERANEKGWHEAALFVVPGESRTKYVNLRDAEAQIPALKDMLNQAQAGAFDVLVLWDYSRLRDLLDPVAKTLAAYNVQLWSVSQPVEPRPPEDYEMGDMASTVQFVSGFTSKAEIAALKRRYRLGMPRRVQKGLTVNHLPLGYRKPPGRELDRQAVPIVDAAKAQIVLLMRDLYLQGQSGKQIADALNAKGYVTARGRPWRANKILGILFNRFYSGWVTFGKDRVTTDPRTGKRYVSQNPESRVIRSKGAHVPLWDDAVQARLDAERKSRNGHAFTGYKTRRLSGILYCACGARMWVSQPWGNHIAWRCSACHKSIRDDKLMPLVAERVVGYLRLFEGETLEIPPSKASDLDTLLVDLRARRDRLTDAYAAGVMSLKDYASRTDALAAQIADAEARLSLDGDEALRRKQTLELLGGLRGLIERVPDYLLQAPEQEVNALLRGLLERVVVGSDVVLAWRG